MTLKTYNLQEPAGWWWKWSLTRSDVEPGASEYAAEVWELVMYGGYRP
jgi:hypothetical protein